MEKRNGFKTFLLLLAGVLILSSCASLPVVNSHWHEQAMDPETNFTHYDVDSRIRYQVSNDSTHLYVCFDTDQMGIQRNIMMNGARISVDTNGKKKGTAYLKYPLMDRSRTQTPERGSMQDDRRKRDPSGRQGMQGPGESMPLRAVFVSGGTQYTFDNMLEKSNFETVLLRDSMGVMYYLVGIPFKEIHPDGLSGIENLAVGIEIEASTSPSQMGPPQGGGRQGGGMAGGGRQGGGRSGGGQRPQADQAGSVPASAAKVKIWFLTDLASDD